MTDIITITPEAPAGTSKIPAGVIIETNADGTKAKVTTDPVAEAAAKEAADKAAAEAKAARPAGLPEKFKTTEDLAKAYAELEAKIGKPVEKPAEKTADAEAQRAAAEAALKAGVDVQALNEEYVRNGGKLSDETMKKLADKGITAPMVNGYIEGLKASASADRARLVDAMNGREADLEAIYEWAGTNMTPTEISGYNNLVTGPNRNIDAALIYLDSMVSRYNASLGKDPMTPVVGTGTPAVHGAQPFADQGEMVAAISDPRYRTNDAYRANVEARIKLMP